MEYTIKESSYHSFAILNTQVLAVEARMRLIFRDDLRYAFTHQSAYTFPSSSMTLDRTVLPPLRASMPLGASSVANLFSYGSGRGPYDPIISSSLSTVTPALLTTCRYLRPDSTSCPTLRSRQFSMKTTVETSSSSYLKLIATLYSTPSLTTRGCFLRFSS